MGKIILILYAHMQTRINENILKTKLDISMVHLFFKFIYLIYLFLAVLGLR